MLLESGHSSEETRFRLFASRSSVQIVLRNLVDWLGACAHVLHVDQRSGSAMLDFQETHVAVTLPVRSTDGIVVGRTDLLAALEHESHQASLHRDHVDMLAER